MIVGATGEWDGSEWGPKSGGAGGHGTSSKAVAMALLGGAL